MVRLIEPTRCELTHDWRASHPRQPRRDRVGLLDCSCHAEGGNAAGRVIFTSPKLDAGWRGASQTLAQNPTGATGNQNTRTHRSPDGQR